MAKGFKHGAGGGTSLNFKVVGGTSAPGNPKANTIWINTDQNITSWHFGTEEPNFYNIKSDEEGYCLYAPHKLTEGEIINFIVPKTITMGFEWVRFVDGTGQDYCVRNGGGTQLEVWPAGMKMSVKISNDLCTMGEYRVRTAYVYGFDNYYHKEGTVWISTGTSSTAPFNALKKNGIMVYPMSAKQYINGAWVDKPIKVYQSGSWKDALLYTVVPNTGITWSKEKNVTVTQNADSTVFSHGAGDGTVHYADFSVDLTPYTKLKIVGNVSASAWSDSNSVKISIGAFSTNASFVTGFTQDIYNRDGTININNTYDISSLSGIYLIRYNARRNNDASSSHTCKFIATSIELS